MAFFLGDGFSLSLLSLSLLALAAAFFFVPFFLALVVAFVALAVFFLALAVAPSVAGCSSSSTALLSLVAVLVRLRGLLRLAPLTRGFGFSCRGSVGASSSHRSSSSFLALAAVPVMIQLENALLFVAVLLVTRVWNGSNNAVGGCGANVLGGRANQQ